MKSIKKKKKYGWPPSSSQTQWTTPTKTPDSTEAHDLQAEASGALWTPVPSAAGTPGLLGVCPQHPSDFAKDAGMDSPHPASNPPGHCLHSATTKDACIHRRGPLPPERSATKVPAGPHGPSQPCSACETAGSPMPGFVQRLHAPG